MNESNSPPRTNHHYRTRIPNPNTSLLHPGEQLTYKELVTILDEDFIPPTNSSRKKQLRDFQSLFSYTQGPGRKLTIEEIYPIEEVKKKQEAVQKKKQKTKKKVKRKAQAGGKSNAGGNAKSKTKLPKNEGDSPPLLQKDEAKETAKETDKADEAKSTASILPAPATPSTLPEKILNPSQFIPARKGKYYLPFVNILLRCLIQRYGTVMYFLPTQLYACCGMINRKYSMTNHSQEYLALNRQWQATANEVRWFYNRTSSKFRTTTEHQLNILEDLGALSFNDSFLLFTADQGFFPATAKEVMQIREAEDYVLDDFQLACTHDVILQHRTKKFYREVMKLLPKQFRGEKYYSCYQIRVNDWILKEVSPMEEEEYCEWKKKMNDLVVAAFDKSVDKYWQKYCEEVNAEAEAGKDIHYYSQRFVENEKQLAEELLRIKDKEG